MYRSAGPNWRIQVNSSEYMYLSGKRCNTILKFRTSGTRYSSRRLRVPLVRKHSQFSSLSSVTLFWRQTLITAVDVLAKPCVDCGLRTGNWCETLRAGGHCFAAMRVPGGSYSIETMSAARTR